MNNTTSASNNSITYATDADADGGMFGYWTTNGVVTAYLRPLSQRNYNHSARAATSDGTTFSVSEGSGPQTATCTGYEAPVLIRSRLCHRAFSKIEVDLVPLKLKDCNNQLVTLYG